jgi:hypothetical protein
MKTSNARTRDKTNRKGHRGSRFASASGNRHLLSCVQSAWWTGSRQRSMSAVPCGDAVAAHQARVGPPGATPLNLLSPGRRTGRGPSHRPSRGADSRAA